MSSPSPTSRTKALLIEEGWTVEITERWNPHARRRQDLLGFGDLIAVKSNEVRMIQTSTVAHLADRTAKILSILAARLWVESPARSIEVICWGKYKVKRGGKAMVWRCQRRMLTLKDFGLTAASGE